MFFKGQLSKFIHITPQSKPEGIFETNSYYEGFVLALHLDRNWYVLTENADDSRINDIDELISEEFEADVLGWCVLKSEQKHLRAALLPFAEGKACPQAITYNSGVQDYWLLKIKPRPTSRLLKR